MMRQIRKSLSALMAVSGMLLFAPSTYALPLLPGSAAPVPVEPLIGPFTFLDSISGLLTSPGDFESFYQTAVYADASNPYCGGCLTFMYQVSNDALSNDALQQVMMKPFTMFATNIFQNPGPFDIFAVGTQAALTASRSLSGDQLTFNFPQGISFGETSNILVIQTDATQYKPGFITVTNDGSDTGNAFAPGAVPEPGALTLLLGFAATALARRSLS